MSDEEDKIDLATALRESKRSPLEKVLTLILITVLSIYLIIFGSREGKPFGWEQAEQATQTNTWSCSGRHSYTIAYTYEVKGIEYKGITEKCEKISPSPKTKIKVYYNPDVPSESKGIKSVGGYIMFKYFGCLWLFGTFYITALLIRDALWLYFFR